MSFLAKSLVLITLVLLSTSPALGRPDKPGVIVSDVPQTIDKNAHYLFYISGYLVEARNTRPVSPRWGVYKYQQILDTQTARFRRPAGATSACGARCR